jgi:hypothetical protein
MPTHQSCLSSRFRLDNAVSNFFIRFTSPRRPRTSAIRSRWGVASRSATLTSRPSASPPPVWYVTDQGEHTAPMRLNDLCTKMYKEGYTHASDLFIFVCTVYKFNLFSTSLRSRSRVLGARKPFKCQVTRPLSRRGSIRQRLGKTRTYIKFGGEPGVSTIRFGPPGTAAWPGPARGLRPGY